MLIIIFLLLLYTILILLVFYNITIDNNLYIIVESTGKYTDTILKFENTF